MCNAQHEISKQKIKFFLKKICENKNKNLDYDQTRFVSNLISIFSNSSRTEKNINEMKRITSEFKELQ